jgi:acetyl esterase/lipase
VGGVPTDRVIGLGHSAGGHLAAWAASRRGSSLPGGRPQVRIGAVVPQAGVLDLAAHACGAGRPRPGGRLGSPL